MPDDRVMVYIDGSNLYNCLKRVANRVDLDYGKFCTKVVGSRHLVRAYFYSAPLDQVKQPTEYSRQRAFFQKIQRTPYFELKLGRLIYRGWDKGEPPQEKGVDVQIATDMIVHGFRNNFDVALLISGDTDLAGALQAVKDQGKHVEIVLVGGVRGSEHLRDIADRIVSIDKDFLKDCWV